MTFQEAIISVINDFGKDILYKESLLNILNDYNAFDESRSLRIILRQLHSEGYILQLAHSEDWKFSSLNLTTRFVDETGIQKEKVEYIANSIAFAIGLCNKKAVYEQKSINKTNYIDCPYCKGKHNITSIYCDKTGKRLYNACDNKHCSEYGKYILSPEAKFCPMCGQPIQIYIKQQCKGSIRGYEYVNLGLSVKWATCNVGANQPHEFGDYFAWGETNPKSNYSKDNCKSFGKKLGEISGLVSFDSARSKWGGSWRMPTKEELQELKDNCTWELITQNNVIGMKVTGPNGNSIFLPGAGQYEGNAHQYIGYGYYSSGTAFKSRYSKNDEEVDEHWFLYFTRYGGQEVWGGFCEIGYTIRPVTN